MKFVKEYYKSCFETSLFGFFADDKYILSVLFSVLTHSMYVVNLFSLFLVHTIVDGYNYMERGDSCQKSDGQPGICFHFNDCPSAIQAVRNREHPEICSFDGIFPIVCCPDIVSPLSNFQVTERIGVENNTAIVPGQDFPIDVRVADDEQLSNVKVIDETNLSLRKCRDYQAVKQNNTNQNNGSARQEYSHMALLGYVEENRIRWKCVGSLISERFVLTTARCAKPQRFGILKYVQIGQLDINSDSEDVKPQDFTVKETYVHPDFQYLSIYNDIGLVELNKPIKFADYVNPACLAVTQDLNDTILEAVGYGLLQLQEKLGSNRMTYSSSENCKEISELSSRSGVAQDQLVCGHGDIDENGTCYVDIGGPLQLRNSIYEFGNFSEIIAVYAFGSTCGASGDIFISILPYISWIENIVWPNS